MKPVLKEWFEEAPWGKIAFTSWGNPAGEPVLLVHGRQDSSATFIPLLDMMPDDFHYVAIDLPGHGKSEPFPIGLMLTRFNFVVAVDIAVTLLGWRKFIYIGHSLGGETGLYYNAIKPNRVKQFILLDIGLAIENSAYRPLPKLFALYEKYYDNYKDMNFDDRVYSKRKALDSVMRARGVTEELAELILSRNLKCIGKDQFKLSWDKRLRLVPPLNLPYDSNLYIFTNNMPPILFIAASKSIDSYKNTNTGRLIKEMRKLKSLEYLELEGGHDVHLTNPERLADDVNAFLKKDFVSSKL